MKHKFEMTNLGILKYFLEIEVKKMDDDIFISQEKYAHHILESFRMLNNKVAPPPTMVGIKLSKEDCSSSMNPTMFKKFVRSLMYLTTTSPGIMHAQSLIPRFMETPKDTHWKENMRILSYVKGTKGYYILYTTNTDFGLVGYIDSDWDGSLDDRKTIFGYVFHMGSGIIFWSSKKQRIVVQSTTDAEYIAKNVAACQAVWLRRILADLKEEQVEAITIFFDNMSSIALKKIIFFMVEVNI